MNGAEKREWRRLEVCIAAEGKLLSEPGGTFPCRVVNLNPDGLSFTAPEGLVSGQEVSLTFMVPGEGDATVRLRVTWAGFLEKSKEFHAGGRFDNTRPRDRDKFLRFYHNKLMASLGG